MSLQNSANSKGQFAEKKNRQIVLHVRQIGFRQIVSQQIVSNLLQIAEYLAAIQTCIKKYRFVLPYELKSIYNELPVVNTIKDLGIMVSDNLSWDKHIQSKVIAARKSFQFLIPLSNQNSGLISGNVLP